MFNLIFRLYHAINHFLFSKGLNRLHSPYVFNLINEYKTRLKNQFLDIENQRIELKSNQTLLIKKDFGSQNQINYPISYTAKKSISPKSICEFYSYLILKNNIKSVLELGTCFGITTSYFAQTDPNIKIETIEGCSATIKIATQVFKKLNIESQIEQRYGDINSILPQILDHKYDMIMIDANHTYDATISYFNQLLPTINNHTIMIIDDIYYSKGMNMAWDEMCYHSQTTLCLDFYRFGLLYFNTNFTPEVIKIYLPEINFAI